MAAGANPHPAPLVGRSRESRRLAQSLEDATAGRPCAVLVHGEAGIGKTRLVSEVCDTFRTRGFRVLWGRCVRFGALSSPYAPLVTALRGWLAGADADEQADVLSGSATLGRLLPELGAVTDPDQPGQLVSLLDTVVARLANRSPVVLVIDDLQWADASSLDVLAYLISGFRSQRLALLATYRDDDLPDGHPLYGWLADIRRLPGVVQLHLERLGLEDTAAQVAALIAGEPDEALSSAVLEKSGGNPYLTELLVQGLPANPTSLPAQVPHALREALLATWHRLPEPARQMLRVLAVSGRPVQYPILADITSAHGVPADILNTCLTEANGAGILPSGGTGGYWFRHPLLADLLYESITPGDRCRIHATYAHVLQTEEGPPEGAQRAGDLARHHELAGNMDDAYAWTLRAAELAAGVYGLSEETHHLRRACLLWPQVTPEARATAGDQVELVLRTVEAAIRAGDLDTGKACVALALHLVDPEQQPLTASRLNRRLTELRHLSGEEFAPLESAREAAHLTDGHPESAERAHALAALAWAEARHLLPGAAARADEAVQVATRVDSQPALAHALWVRAMTRVGHPDGLSDAEDAYRIAEQCGDVDDLASAAVFRGNCLNWLGRLTEAAAVEGEAYQTLARLGAARHYGAFLAAMAADDLLQLGNWDRAGDLLRQVLTTRSQGNAGGLARLVAARLAARRGLHSAAQQHLQRADELVAAHGVFLALPFPQARVEVLVAADEPALAVEVVRSSMSATTADDPQWADMLMVWGARAAADLAQHARDRGDARSLASATTALDQVIALRGTTASKPFALGGPDDVVRPALKAVFAAECGRCGGDQAQATPWRDAGDACTAAGLRWEAAYAFWRHAHALLAGEGRRDQAAAPLRQAYSIAVDLAANPLREQIVASAQIARILLDQPKTVEQAAVPAPLAELTRRELEVLSHLASGRSYREIAAALVISEKTVSVHVSSILRKTGTANRIQASSLAQRLGLADDKMGGRR